MNVHTALGPGLLESAYMACLHYELLQSGMCVEKEKELPLIYDNIKLNVGYRIDLLVENKIVVEVKAVENLHPVYSAQVLTYLRLSGNTFGLLINFNVKSLRDGIKRIANGIIE
jgi:GxxExxY protein